MGKDETIKLLEANEKPLMQSILVNTLKIKPSELRNRLEKKDIELEPINWISYGFKVKKSSKNLGSLHEYLQGYYYLQNIASMIPALILDPKPDDFVIDMCAAPGSKATQLAQIMKNRGKLLLIELNMKRITALEMNVRRLGIANSIVINDDATNIHRMKISADKVLLDAPCTGEGLIRQDKTRKTSKRIKDIRKMASIQKKLLESGLQILKPKGLLLYSTCSIAPEENELVINEVLEDKNDFAIVKIPIQYGVKGLNKIYNKNLLNSLKLSQRLYPHLHDTIGFYICLIKRLA